ncbi:MULTISPECIES: MarR family transcriptional regulator [unclassified Leifsonia]|uniref:MarR family winged helix-turn-helix transcriptional regulator n=1 Tax=unclassified Leifsonia TaxID=2663824 RepID=UPI000A18BA02|nr:MULTISPECIES: MarR family transcriptional regulator [unclassified Leifsonia]QJA00717.1 MarR family transcriptional regulator [Leifsonia sp. PS1209]
MSYLDLAEDLRLAVGEFVRATRAETDVLPRVKADSLSQLERRGPQTIAQLAAARGVRHQGMSRAVAELESHGLVHRMRNPADARGWVISLSERGQAALEADRTARRDTVARGIEDRLDANERALLAQVPALLRKLGS